MRALALFVKMAARNMAKYRRRSLQSAAAIFLGVLFVSLAGGFLAGFGYRITQNFIEAQGHVAVTAPGYTERAEMMPLDRLVPGAAAAQARMESAAPGIRAFAALDAPGLISRGGPPGEAVSEESEAVVCSGVTPWSRDIVNPALRSVQRRITGGRFFQGPGDRGMILAESTARSIRAAPGDGIIFLCSDAYGSFSMIELPLLGVFSAPEYGEELPSLMDLASLQEVAAAADGAARISVYALGANGDPLDPRTAAESVRLVQAAAASLALASQRWDQASGSSAAMMGFLDTFMVIAYILFGVVAIVGITNSILLSVQDRMRDFGTLRAISFTSGGVGTIIAVEALLLGACASLLAVLVAAGASLYFEQHGIPMRNAVRGVWAQFPSEITTVTNPLQLLVSFAAGTVTPVLAALYPMGVLRRMSIRQALGFT